MSCALLCFWKQIFVIRKDAKFLECTLIEFKCSMFFSTLLSKKLLKCYFCVKDGANDYVSLFVLALMVISVPCATCYLEMIKPTLNIVCVMIP